MADVNPEPRTIDEQMDRPIALDSAERDLTERLEPPGQRRVVRNGDVQFELLCQRT